MSEDNGSPFENMDEYINTEKGRQAYLNRLEMLRKRFGDNPAIFGWELWNEMNAIESEGLWDWNEYMLPKVHAMFPKNMVMQSLGSFDHEGTRNDYRYINRMQSNDVAQIHRYLDLGASLDICKAPMDMLAGNSIDELLSYQVTKPMLLAEVGGVKPKHTGPIEIYATDIDGILLHDLLFAPFFSGAAGPGHAWHWDSYIDKNNLWYHFQRFSEAIKGIDPVQEKFIPVKIPHPKLRIYALVGKKTILLWCRNAENDWENEFVKGVSPAILSGLSVDVSSLLAKNEIKAASIYDPWKNEWKNGKKVSLIVLPDFKRSVVLFIEKLIPHFSQFKSMYGWVLINEPGVGGKEIRDYSKRPERTQQSFRQFRRCPFLGANISRCLGCGFVYFFQFNIFQKAGNQNGSKRIPCANGIGNFYLWRFHKRFLVFGHQNAPFISFG